MTAYTQINGVRTWYDTRGQGEMLVMLHPGGIGVDSRTLTSVASVLDKHFQVWLPERRGHGRTPDVPGAYSYELVADDTIAFVEQIVGQQPIRLMGMSDGAVVALLVAQKRPDLVERLVFTAGVFHRDGWLPGVIDPKAEPPMFLIDSYIGITPDDPTHYHVVHQKLNQMHQDGPQLTPRDLAQVAARTLIMVGDDDEVSVEHAVLQYRSMRNAELAVIPGTSHGLLVEKPMLCSAVILDFLLQDPVPTFAPIRRQHHDTNE